jgi:NodT family efflux transporter outer membrane factor (OMF) lipoprotein
MKSLIAIGAVSMLALLPACTVGPDFERPAATASRHYDEQAEQQGPTGSQQISLGSHIDGDWWSAFRSPKLDMVMRKAIAGNLDLVAADATIAQANEAVASAAGGLRPQLDFGAAGGGQRAPGGTGASTAGFYSVGPQVSFDFDIFGGRKRLVEQRVAFADFQRHRFDAAYLTLTGDVATQAFLLASARAQIDAVQILLEDDRKTLELISTALLHGSATRLDVALATTQFAQDQTLLPPLRQQRDTARHALSVLAGAGPADWAPPDFDLADFALPANLAVSLPSEMARNRPDILEAEAELHATSAAIGIATADLYPRLIVSASFSQAAAGAAAASLWSTAAGLSAPIFHGGSLRADRRGAVDAWQASLATYRQTVVRSLGQVADLLQAIDHDGEDFSAQERTLEAAETSLRLNRTGYQAGETGVLQVLDAERAYQRALLGTIGARTARYLDTARLSVALGGNSNGAFARRTAPPEQE